MMAPVDAVEKLLTKTGWDRDTDVDLVELNEAFAVAAIAVTRQLKLNPEKVNVNGGAVAIGHPIGASGARILVTLLYELERRNLERGIAALCLGDPENPVIAGVKYFDLLAILDRPSPGPEMPPLHQARQETRDPSQ